MIKIYTRLIFILIFAQALVSPPSVLPYNIRLFDLLFLLLVPSIVIYFYRASEIRIVRSPAILTLAIYSLFMLFLPIIGIHIYGHTLLSAGGVRWMIMFIIAIHVLHFYSNYGISVVYDIVIGCSLVLVVYILFFVGQVLDLYQIISFNDYTEYWYQGRSRDGDLGESHYGNRFSGPAANIGSAGRYLAVVAVVFLSLALHKVSNRVYAILFVVSTGLLVATFDRTSLVALVVFTGILTVLAVHQRGGIKELLRYVFMSLPGFAMLYIIDIGGIRSNSHRFLEILLVMTGQAGWSETTGRDIDVWVEQASEVQEEYVLGTLGHPARVHEFELMDSYFMLTYYQGGFLLMSVYALLGIFLLYSAITRIDTLSGSIAFGLTLIILLNSLTQTMSGISQMVLLSTAAILCVHNDGMMSNID